MARGKRKVPTGTFPATIETLSHDGRGIARLDGKTVFISNALPGEVVEFQYLRTSRRFDEGKALHCQVAAADRVEPPCRHAALCGGCSLQHLAPSRQLLNKQAMVAEQLAHFGQQQPEAWLPSIVGPTLGYRSKARLGVKWVPQKGLPLVGFREKSSRFLAEITHCDVLEPPLDAAIMPLRELIGELQAKARIPQVEIAHGDDDCALVFRHLDPLSDADQQRLIDFCRQRHWHCYLQPGNEQTTHRVWPLDGPERLYYSHPDFSVRLGFHPHDFTQVSRTINRAMVKQAIDLLEVNQAHRVLDMFCGLGNFTLPLARRAGHVVGIEGSDAMVARGAENARANVLSNVDFFRWDLTQDASEQAWAQQGFDRILIDPPRAGAKEVLPLLAKLGATRLVYVSCNPSTLARDAGELDMLGYRLAKVGVMDMFPHTSHVESMALFVRR